MGLAGLAFVSSFACWWLASPNFLCVTLWAGFGLVVSWGGSIPVRADALAPPEVSMDERTKKLSAERVTGFENGQSQEVTGGLQNTVAYLEICGKTLGAFQVEGRANGWACLKTGCNDSPHSFPGSVAGIVQQSQSILGILRKPQVPLWKHGSAKSQALLDKLRGKMGTLVATTKAEKASS